ncbi:hypothetical protein DM01DRAFT_1338154 [Hesseltinella vesiculosa]|uniref:Uncharacterized protein n=1 Tax=Hesseltinella vesiculosa TaxID=101127 RepID=A0A1X2GB14_9FUNG|nr:hypothetical protein DM01DRAFT_1338154 [Hesseltinella vesiculosa]
MPSTTMLLRGPDDIALSPVQTSWVFDEFDTTPVEPSMDSEDESQGHDPLMTDPSLPPAASYTTNDPLPPHLQTLPLPSTTILHRPIRAIPRFTRRRRLLSANTSTIPPSSIGVHWSPTPHAQCFMDAADSPDSPLSPSTVSSSPMAYYPLGFKILTHDGGCYSTTYNIENVLRNDPTVYCSGRVGAVNIHFCYRGGKTLTDTSCVFTRIIIKSPQQGFTAPCKEGLVFISHQPIDIDKTRRFDQYTRDDFDQYVRSTDACEMGNDNPVAWFTIQNKKQDVINIEERSGKYVLIKLLRSDREDDNIDIQYIGFVGYAGPRSFASSPKLL